jgi:signal transduction histidine kinase
MPRPEKKTDHTLKDTQYDGSRTIAEVLLSGQAVTRELEDIKQLHQISNLIVDDEGSIDDLYHAILRSAMEMMHADFASLQLLIPETNELELLVSENFHPGSAKFWKYMNADPSSALGLALANNIRVVIEDIEDIAFKMNKGDYDAYTLSGIVSVQSTPLISRTGRNVGIISTHWKRPHTATEREMGLFDIVARQVADLIERKLANERLRKSELKIKELNNNLEQQVKERTEELMELNRRQKHLEEWQQQQIFRVILDTQEEERRRIAESLHNSLGQLLYGVKLSLGHMLKADMSEKDRESLRNTDKLLNQAIAESRRISHELMPTILEDFGLKSAVEDICRQLSDGVKIKCVFKGLTQRFDRYIETAVYRIIQELLLNVVKHSGASHALVVIEVEKASVLILVQDNGKGFDLKNRTGDGIGLKTIRNKVNLLNGNINIVSIPGEGTVINIDVPVKIDN